MYTDCSSNPTASTKIDTHSSICAFPRAPTVMGDYPDYPPGNLSADLDDLVVPDTPEYLWDSDSAIDHSFSAGTLTGTFFSETQLDSFIPVDVWPSHSTIDYLDCGCPYYGPPPPTPLHNPPPPPATPYNGPAPPATPSHGRPASSGTTTRHHHPAEAPPAPLRVVYSDYERQMLAILLPGILDLI